MAGGWERAVVVPACRRLCIWVKIGSRPVKNGLRRNGTFQTDTCPVPIEEVPGALDGLVKGLGVFPSFQIIDGFADALHNIDKGIVMRGPAGDGLAIGREDLEFGERRSLPVGGTQDDREDTCLVGIMPGDRLRHLNTVTEIGGHEVSADQQQNDVIRVEVLNDL